MTCCVCGGSLDGKPKLTHEADEGNSRYCSLRCLREKHLLSAEQINTLTRFSKIDSWPSGEYRLQAQNGPTTSVCNICSVKYESAGETEYLGKSWFRGWCPRCIDRVESIVAEAPSLSAGQFSKLPLLLGIEQIDMRPRKERKPPRPPTHSQMEIDAMIDALPRIPGPNAIKEQNMEEEDTFSCARCGKVVLRKRFDHRFCSDACRRRYWRHPERRKNKPKPQPTVQPDPLPEKKTRVAPSTNRSTNRSVDDRARARLRSLR